MNDSDLSSAAKIAAFFTKQTESRMPSITSIFTKIILDNNPKLRLALKTPDTSYGLDIVYNSITGKWNDDALIAVVATFVNKYSKDEDERMMFIDDIMVGLYLKDRIFVKAQITSNHYIYKDLASMMEQAIEHVRSEYFNNYSPIKIPKY